METKSGKIKGISNLARTKEGKYFEKINYGIWETQEPGSTFKLMTLIAALEDGIFPYPLLLESFTSYLL